MIVLSGAFLHIFPSSQIPRCLFFAIASSVYPNTAAIILGFTHLGKASACAVIYITFFNTSGFIFIGYNIFL